MRKWLMNNEPGPTLERSMRRNGFGPVLDARVCLTLTPPEAVLLLIGWGFPASCVPVDKQVDRGTDDDVEQEEADDQSC